VGLVVDTAQDAAKDVADIILLKKDLKVIIEGINLGRQAFFNIVKFLRHTMTDNFGNFFTIGFLSFFLPFLPLTPLQILLTDFLTDLPLVALPTDWVSSIETRKLAKYQTKELFLLLFALSFISGMFMTVPYLIFKNSSPQFLRTIIFTATTLTGISIFYSIRTNDWFFKSKPSKWMHLTIFISTLFLFIFLYLPLSRFFEFSFLLPSYFLFLVFFNFFFFYSYR
jgi:Mg2+-importing ATPase